MSPKEKPPPLPPQDFPSGSGFKFTGTAGLGGRLAPNLQLQQLWGSLRPGEVHGTSPSLLEIIELKGGISVAAQGPHL